MLADKKNQKIDGLVDIMVRQEDASKVNRIAERFNFIDVATIKSEIEKEKQENLKAEKQKSETESIVVDLRIKKYNNCRIKKYNEIVAKSY